MLESMQWHTPGEIVIARFEGPLSVEDIRQMSLTLYQMVKAEGRPPHVHVLFDLTHMTTFDADILHVGTLLEALRKHPLMQWYLIVHPKPSPLVRFAITTIASIAHPQIRQVASVEEGLEFLRMKNLEQPTSQ